MMKRIGTRLTDFSERLADRSRPASTRRDAAADIDVKVAALSDSRYRLDPDFRDRVASCICRSMNRLDRFCDR